MRWIRTTVNVALVGWFGVLSGSVPPPETVAAEIRFNQDIRPILSEHCFACHGPDAASRQADLRLDTLEGATAAGAVVPGDAESSEIMARILSDDPEYQMPPESVPRRLSEQDTQRLRQWIDEGAAWEPHWAFIDPVRPQLPQPPGVADWARNPIDHFILDAMTRAGLAPNPVASRYVLARRAALDLTGLPPSQESLDAYRADDNPPADYPQAFDRFVDGLLASPHAGEHRARYWLDAARYGDTHGMHVDNYREIWPYRDWVIHALNANMPFDQFVVEQLAGDLLPGRSLDQQIATGFNRCNITTSEGGAIPEELNVRYMIDRVETTATVFLGLTAGCAVCHDHKYDPLTQREFYQLGAFFNNTTQPAMDGNQKDTPPAIAIPSQEFREEWDSLQTRRKQLRADMSQHVDNPRQAWSQRGEIATTHPISDQALELWLPLVESDQERFPLPESARWADDHPFGRRGIRFDDELQRTVEFPAIRSDEPLSVSFWYRTPEQVIGNVVLEQVTHNSDDKPLGWKITSGSAGTLTFSMMDGQGHTISGNLPDNEALRPHAWQHVCVRYSGGQSNSSISILADGREIALRKSSESYIDATTLTDGSLEVASNLRTGGLSDVRIFRRWLSDDEVTLLARDGILRRLLTSDAPWNALNESDQELWRMFYRHTLDEVYRLRSSEWCATSQRYDFIYSRSTTTLVMQEKDMTPKANVLVRGEYTQPSEEVEPGVPAMLPPLPPGAPRNRLGLAQWLVHPDQPLTARVMVNRMWQSVFGVGLVKTAEDFGVMGARPSHPELLDWLAVEFEDSGWDMRHMLKLMVTSSTYRQSSHVSAEKLQQDPDNTLLARSPRLRLDAEVLRDQALAVCGLLQHDIGGPSVRPYQPSGLWNVVAIVGSNTGRFEQDHGQALYRRSLYTFWKRTSPPPSLAAFNAPTREQCTVRRERTNTPLQALVMMNDPQFVEAARYLAAASMQDPCDDAGRIQRLLKQILRHPGLTEDVQELEHDVTRYREHFAAHEESARQLIQVGDSPAHEALNPVELASWTMVVNTIMNRDDFINK